MSGSLYKMNQLCEITSSKRIHASDYRSEGVPFYRGKEITEKFKGNIDVTTEIFIEREVFEKIRNKFGAPTAGDLLLTSVGTLGSPYVVKQDEEFYFKDGNLTWFRNFNNLDSKYLFYWLQSPNGNAQLKRATIGSSQPAYTIVLLKEMEITLPPLPTQRKIAAILSAYDDLIENNLRRIKILEEMVQNLYREWFVKFRFPGHEKAKFVDSLLGRIPEGWGVVKLGDLIDIRKGKSITKNTVVNGPVPVVAGGLEPAYYHNESNTQQPVITISASGANAGYVRLYHENVWASDCSVIDLNTTPYVFYYYLQLNNRYIEVNRLQRGAAQPHVYPKDLMNLDACRIPISILDDFDKHVSSVFQMIGIFTSKNKNLRRTRDLLLPKLISGEVDVSELDIKISEEASA